MIKKTSYFLTGYFPLFFSLAVCSGFGTLSALVVSGISILLMPELQSKKLMPYIISFIIIGRNSDNPLLTSLTFGILLLIYSVFNDKLKNIFSKSLSPGIMLAGALTATVLFTTNYFGIGATGENVTEMLKSYVSLGFHPNWRGVLYGTIVMVIMITFPRKFKSFNNYVSAPFIALIFTLILNLFLNPSDMTTAITEITELNISDFHSFIKSNLDFEFSYSSVLSGIALFMLCASLFSDDKNFSKKDCFVNSGANILSCGIISLPLPYGINKNKNTIIPRLIATLILFASFIIFKDTVARIPLHSCAVVIIVAAWENVRWMDIKNSFSKFTEILLFVLSLIISMISDISIGIIISFIASVLLNTLNPKKGPAD